MVAKRNDKLEFCAWCCRGDHSSCRNHNPEQGICVCHLLEHPRLPFPKELGEKEK